MADTTLEEARRCPRCEQPGNRVGVNVAKAPGVSRGTKIETYECVNERCEYGPITQPVKMNGQRWAVQINPDGTIPPKGTRDSQPKEWDIDNHTSPQEQQRARDMLAAEWEHQIRGDRR